MKDRQRKEFQAAWIEAWQQSGDEKALELLIKSCEGLIATQIRSVRRWSSVDRDDLYSEGVLGIMRAAEKFDPLRGKPFSACAAIYIRDQILRCAQRQGMPVSFANSRKEEKVQRRIFGLVAAGEAAGLDRAQALLDAAMELNISEEHAAEAMTARIGFAIAGFDDAGDDGDRLQLAADELPAEERMDEGRPAEIVAEALSRLDDRSRRIVTARYMSEDFVSLDSLAAEFGVSRERVGLIETDALKYLAWMLEERGIELGDLL